MYGSTLAWPLPFDHLSRGQPSVETSPKALTQNLLLMDVLQPVQGLHEALHGPTALGPGSSVLRCRMPSALLPLSFQPVGQEVGEELGKGLWTVGSSHGPLPGEGLGAGPRGVVWCPVCAPPPGSCPH